MRKTEKFWEKYILLHIRILSTNSMSAWSFIDRKNDHASQVSFWIKGKIGIINYKNTYHDTRRQAHTFMLHKPNSGNTENLREHRLFHVMSVFNESSTVCWKILFQDVAILQTLCGLKSKYTISHPIAQEGRKKTLMMCLC